MRNLHIAIVSALSILACVAPNLAAQRDVHAQLVAPENRKPAPAFHLVSNSGKAMQVSDYRGKIVLLNFWATDCGGCKIELPSLIAIENTYHDAAFTTVGISMDISWENLKNADEAWTRVKPFIVSHKLNYPILMGDDSLFKSYGLDALPATFLIDKSGRIAATYVGIVSQSDVEANIKTLLSQK